MNFFDDDEYGSNAPSSIEEDLEEAVSSFQEEDSTPESLMSDATRRFSLASYYMEVIKNPIFDSNQPEAQLVSKEIGDFAKTRMEILLGVKQAEEAKQVELPFTDQEIQVLKAFAAKFASKTVGLNTIQDTPTKPEMNRIAPPQETVSPKRAQKAKAPQQKPVQAKTDVPKKGKDGLVDVSKWSREKIQNEMSQNTPFRYKGKVLVIHKNAAGEFYFKDVTPQTRSEEALPMPTGQSLEIALENNASRSFSRAEQMAGSNGVPVKIG